MNRAVGYLRNPEPPHNPGEAWRERRREQLAEDAKQLGEWMYEWLYLVRDPALARKSYRDITTGSIMESLAAVRELRAYVDDKITERAQDDWQDHLDSAGEP